MGVFGYEIIGDINNSVQDVFQGAAYSAPENGIATHLNLYMTWIPTEIFAVRGAVYEMSSLQFLAETVEVIGPIADGWLHLPLTSNPEMTVGSMYLMLVNGNQGSQCYRSINYDMQPFSVFGGLSFLDGWPLTLQPTSYLAHDYSMSIEYVQEMPPTEPTMHSLTVTSEPSGIPFTVN